jgi:hypothetical protein
MTIAKLKHFNNHGEVVNFVWTEIEATLLDDAESTSAGDKPTAKELRAKVHDIRQVMRPAIVVLQEGGSSSEGFFVHQFDTTKQAESYRRSAARGSYRTTPPVTVPGELASHPQFEEVVRELLSAADEVDYP